MGTACRGVRLFVPVPQPLLYKNVASVLALLRCLHEGGGLAETLGR